MQLLNILCKLAQAYCAKKPLSRYHLLVFFVIVMWNWRRFQAWFAHNSSGTFPTHVNYVVILPY